MAFEGSPNIKLKTFSKQNNMFDCTGWTLIKRTPVLTRFCYKWVKPSNRTFIFNVFWKGNE